MDNTYIATVFWQGIGNEILKIKATSDSHAFLKLFNYYQSKGNELGCWNADGSFENHEDWNFMIESEDSMVMIE